jgi:Na+(H+)/acetate symporter ActP
VGTAVAVVVPFLLALVASRLDLAQTVAMAFAVSASTFAPLLVLGIWWRGLTVRGGVAGLVAGGTLALGAVVVTLAAGPVGGILGALLAEPAAWTVPVAFTVMVVGSRLSRGGVPPGTNRTMAQLHAPESLDLRR